MMGGEGLTNATRTAMLNANYIKARLENAYQYFIQVLTDVVHTK
jgi:glycine cleavage system protein P-like pyridoxal-binding family